MEQNILLILEYDGTLYHGWQRQTNGVSVQQTLEHALSGIYQERIAVTGAGRTDAGVHAFGQAAGFRAHRPVPLDKLPEIVNAKLPGDIHVRSARLMPDSFHARYAARGKRYRYVMEQGGGTSAFSGRYSWNVGGTLDVSAMEAAARSLPGRHDFRYFTVSGVSAWDFVRTIQRLDIAELPEGPDLFPWQRLTRPLMVEAVADGFLYKMVRIIVGRLAAVGRGALLPERMAGFLDGSFRENIPPAPPQGLMLMEVYY